MHRASKGEHADSMRGVWLGLCGARTLVEEEPGAVLGAHSEVSARETAALVEPCVAGVMAHGCEESLRSSGGQEGLAVGSVARGERREELRHRVESARALEVPREQSRSHLRHLRLAQALLHVVIAGEGGEEDCARPADTRVGHVAAEQANGLIKGPKVHEGLAYEGDVMWTAL